MSVFYLKYVNVLKLTKFPNKINYFWFEWPKFILFGKFVDFKTWANLCSQHRWAKFM